MTSIWDRSATAASNTSTPPAGFPADQVPSLVAPQFRAEMAYETEFVHSILAAGTADALTVTYTNVPASLTDGMEIHVRATAANTTTTPTLNVNSLGAKTITKLGGTALVAGDIAGNLHELDLRYNSANTRWELMNPATVAPSALSGKVGLADGGTHADLSATGGTSQVLKQTSSGGDITVGQLATTDLSDITASGSYTPSDSSGAGLTFTSVSAKYAKVGNLVFAYGTLTYPTTTDSSAAKVSLPIAVPATTYAKAPGEVFVSSDAADSFHALPQPNTSYFEIGSQSSHAAILNSNLSGIAINFMVIYPSS